MIPIIKPWLGEEEAQAAREAILSGWVAQGPRVRQFEDAIAARVDANAAIAVSSCTTGLHLSLIGAGVGAGDDDKLINGQSQTSSRGRDGSTEWNTE